MVRIFWYCILAIFITFLMETFFGDGFNKEYLALSLKMGILLGVVDYLSDILSTLKELKEELTEELTLKSEIGIIELEEKINELSGELTKELERVIIEQRIDGEIALAKIIRKLESVDYSLQDINSSISSYSPY